jgi:hypothetical protein
MRNVLTYVLGEAGTVVESAVEPRVIQLRGASDTEFVHDIIIRGLTCVPTR